MLYLLKHQFEAMLSERRNQHASHWFITYARRNNRFSSGSGATELRSAGVSQPICYMKHIDDFHGWKQSSPKLLPTEKLHQELVYIPWNGSDKPC